MCIHTDIYTWSLKGAGRGHEWRTLAGPFIEKPEEARPIPGTNPSRLAGATLSPWRGQPWRGQPWRGQPWRGQPWRGQPWWAGGGNPGGGNPGGGNPGGGKPGRGATAS